MKSLSPAKVLIALTGLFPVVGLVPVAHSAAPGLQTLVSPIQTQISNSWIRYTWTADTNAAWYHLYVLKTSSAATNQIFWDQWYASTNSAIDVATGEFAVDLGSHYSGSYKWWVQAWNRDGLGPWSVMGTFTVPNLTPGPVTLISPSGSQPNTSRITYTWTDQPNAAYYEFYLTRNGVGISDDWFYTGLDWFGPGTNIFTLENYGRGGGYFQWWVRAWNPDGLGPWSAPLSYQVPVQIPAATGLIAPYGTFFKGQSATFLWTPVEGATWYRIVIQQRQWNGSYFNTVDYWTTKTSYTAAAGSLPIGTYRWSVQTWNEDGYGPWSAIFPMAIAGY